VSEETEAQRDYYSRTAEHYDAMHLRARDEHGKALGAFMGLAEVCGPVGSILDIGAGTGRAIEMLKGRWPRARVMGVEPVASLREEGYKKGIHEDELVAGDGLNLAFGDDSFDFVIETGILHHVRTPVAVVNEMTRIARKGIMISDSNNVGQGSAAVRVVKYVAKSLGLWPACVYLQTRGKMYKSSEGDGIFYSFSAFDCVAAPAKKFPVVHYMNSVRTKGFDLYRGAGHVMIFACKE
jgi:ubiquinone/menaquinone biosynthesis C-methylase UbiE